MKKYSVMLAAMFVLCFVPISFSQNRDVRVPPKIYNGQILNGKAISLPAPEYPEAAKSVKVTGSVSVRVLIDKDGIVETAEALSGHPLLRPSSIDAARKAKFRPTLLGGKPVKVRGIIVYNFGERRPKNKTPFRGKSSKGVINGLAILLPKPEYPAAAEMVCALGRVNVWVEIDDEGKVTAASALKGHPLLRGAAVEAAKKAKFRPAGDPAKPVSGVIVYKFHTYSDCEPKQKEN